ncbi:LOW QUALITY PROTEIN: uncharacterized protein [Venturia canescens]|uniref:LOW QUALITY PROTEIN: uncharacterized protein n=1 Tax=Venturia canescens TaxID=32260 RepID=UPI001C9C133C|nr:LOW QUALITY PROTEIN: uncharacterized protein LOC122411530 [Venturia canescens]
MYESHNPGFCYHSNGAIKESGPVSSAPEQGTLDSDDSYEFVKAMLFTERELDVEKLVCLHLLAAYTTNYEVDRLPQSDTRLSSRFHRGLISLSSGHRWPTERSLERFFALLRNRRRLNLGESGSSGLERRCCSSGARDNAEVLQALSARSEAVEGARRAPMIPAHVCAVLGAYSDRSKVGASFSKDPRSARAFNEGGIAGDLRSEREEAEEPAVSVTSFPSFRSDTKIDRSLTMLRQKPWKNVDSVKNVGSVNRPRSRNELTTIKPSCTMLRSSSSKSGYEELDSRRFQRDRGSVSSSSSFDLAGGSPRQRKTLKYRRSVYLNSPLRSFALKNQEFRVVDILVNSQIQALVHSVLEVLKRVNPQKVRKIIEISGDPNKIRDILQRTDMQYFVESLLQQPLVTSPESFVLSRATAVDEIESRLEASIANELIALTLELPPSSCLEFFVGQIRDNVLRKLGKTISSRTNVCVRGSNRYNINDEISALESDDGMPNVETVEQNGNEITKLYDRKNFESQDYQSISSISNHRYDPLVTDSRPAVTQGTEETEKKITKTVRATLTNEKFAPKPQKSGTDVNYADPDRVILRRMTNSQRILVGRMCAALKNRRINNEGLIREKTPLAALITPVLSRESIKSLTRGTIYSKFVGTIKQEQEKEERTRSRTEKLTAPVLAKIRRDISEYETKKRFNSFMGN